MQSWKQDLLFKNRLTGKLCQVFLFYVPNLVGISIDYLANLENVIANHLGNLEIFQGDQISLILSLF